MVMSSEDVLEPRVAIIDSSPRAFEKSDRPQYSSGNFDSKNSNSTSLKKYSYPE
jgi:hypothetical protein